MSMEEKIRKENEEISKLISKVIRNIKNNYEEKEQTKIMQMEIENREKYSPDNLFKNKQSNIRENNISETIQETALTKVKKLKIFQKIFDKIKGLFIKK